MNLSTLRGWLTHTSGDTPFIAVLPPSSADRATLEVRLHPYHLTQIDLGDDVGSDVVVHLQRATGRVEANIISGRAK